MTPPAGAHRFELFDGVRADENVPPSAVAQTHLSTVFFAGNRAYKLYKPFDAGFIDARTVDQRLALCRQEVELNRRFSPDVYRGVMHLDDDDGLPRDHAVVMRRLPPEPTPCTASGRRTSQ